MTLQRRIPGEERGDGTPWKERSISAYFNLRLRPL